MPDAVVLNVRLSHAVGLKAADSNGLSDPYVKLSLGKAKFTSKKVMKNLNPRWDEEFIFRGVYETLVAEPLCVAVWDYDQLSMNDPLGDATLDLRKLELVVGTPVECSVRLNDKQKVPGEVFFVVQLEGDSLPDEDIKLAKIQAIVRGRSQRLKLKSEGITLKKVVMAPVNAVASVGRGIQEASQVITHSRHHVVSDAEVDAPTPAGRWFTPREGWMVTDDEGRAPHLLMPTARTIEALFPVESQVIGELKLEVLEAEGLPNTDSVAGMSFLGNLTDSYAFVLFEGTAARTSVVRDSLSPRWAAADPGSFRAFKVALATRLRHVPSPSAIK